MSVISILDNGTKKELDRTKWHQPLVSIIITHYNYSAHLEDALLSIIDQSHPNWECVIVDDASQAAHAFAAESIIKAVGCEKIRLIRLRENAGQIAAFFEGLAETRGEFVCLLDPDDRYKASFLTEMLEAHLNPVVYCPVLSCEQNFLHNGAVVTGINSASNMRFIEKDGYIPNAIPCQLRYFPADAKGWHWTSTSALMFRRSALNLLRPIEPLSYKRFADTYLAKGAHMLGGSLYLNQPLVYRGIHSENAWITDQILASGQRQRRASNQLPEAEKERLCLSDAIKMIKANGGEMHLQTSKSRKFFLRRWQRSFMKRWRKFF